MLKSCKYCGGIHDRKYICPSKPKSIKKVDEKHRFRTLQVWIKKRNHVRDRDNRLCQVCIRNLFNTFNQYTFDDLQIHHIIPLKEDWNKRLDEENLIALCRPHHEAAEAGEIPRQALFDIALEQMSKY
jgi:5-methylcytosine-specific restriction enzyme A